MRTLERILDSLIIVLLGILFAEMLVRSIVNY